jgi:hydroxymethylpyrimidine pyrophosphatase-like HAD family hydrolase
MIREDRGLPVLPVSELPRDTEITNLSALGERSAIEAVTSLVKEDEHLVAYMGTAIEDDNLCWVDIHHSDGSKGGAVSVLKEELGVSRVICFGDSDNDLSMFAQADESYAPENAKSDVRAAATEVIGHHDEDGIARFLRERFDL